MRPVLVLPLALCLLAIDGAAPATAAPAAGAEPVSGAEGEVGVNLHFKAGGFVFKLENDSSDAEDQLTLRVSGRRQLVNYMVHGRVTENGIEAKLGKIGEISLAFEPTQTRIGETPDRCRGEPRRHMKGVYVGTFHFRGERGYVEVERGRIEGGMHVVPPRYCPPPEGAHRLQPTGRRAAREGEGLAVLSAGVRRRDHGTLFGVIANRRPDESSTAFIASTYEVREAVQIVHYAIAQARASTFRFDLGEGTAAVKPPSPFQGWARFRRGPHGHNSWRGSLRVSMLGLGFVDLTGPRFRARITNEYNDE